MSGIIDFHTHAFPDELAARAIPFLEEEGNVKAWLDGTAADLLRSMDRAGIERSVICSIATRPQPSQTYFMAASLSLQTWVGLVSGAPQKLHLALSPQGLHR